MEENLWCRLCGAVPPGTNDVVGCIECVAFMKGREGGPLSHLAADGRPPLPHIDEIGEGVTAAQLARARALDGRALDKHMVDELVREQVRAQGLSQINAALTMQVATLAKSNRELEHKLEAVSGLASQWNEAARESMRETVLDAPARPTALARASAYELAASQLTAMLGDFELPRQELVNAAQAVLAAWDCSYADDSLLVEGIHAAVEALRAASKD